MTIAEAHTHSKYDGMSGNEIRDDHISNIQTAGSTEDRQAYLENLKAADIVMYTYVMHQLIEVMGLKDWLFAI
jgi:hypothetical protein